MNITDNQVSPIETILQITAGFFSMHNWNDQQVIKILQNCRQAMPERLLVVETVLNDGFKITNIISTTIEISLIEDIKI